MYCQLNSSGNPVVSVILGVGGNTAEEAARLKHVRARLCAPDALRAELDALKKSMELVYVSAARYVVTLLQSDRQKLLSSDRI